MSEDVGRDSWRVLKGGCKTDLWCGEKKLLRAERILFQLGRSGGGDGGPCLLRRQGEGMQNKSFSFVLSAAPTVAMTTMPAMLPSVPFKGIPTAVVLRVPSVPPTIYPR